jgi:hypothetical protein
MLQDPLYNLHSTNEMHELIISMQNCSYGVKGVFPLTNNIIAVLICLNRHINSVVWKVEHALGKSSHGRIMLQ